MIEGGKLERGDILKLNLDPRTGSEQSGYRPVIVISPLEYNRISKLALICPITRTEKAWKFKVKLSEEMITSGFILVDQIRVVDYNNRNAIFIEKATEKLIEEVLAILETLVT